MKVWKNIILTTGIKICAVQNSIKTDDENLWKCLVCTDEFGIKSNQKLKHATRHKKYISTRNLKVILWFLLWQNLK